MSQFVNLSPEQSKNAYHSIYKNALRKKRDALALININKSYDSANSLLVLSSEELIKSIVVFLHSEGFEVYKIKTAKKIFSDHRYRHSIAKIFEMINGVSDSFLRYEKIEKSNKEISKDVNVNTLINLFFDFKESAKPLEQTTERNELIENFNDNKNKGLYTDFREELQISSEQITEETYHKTLEIIKRIFRFYKMLMIQFHPNAKNHPTLLKYVIEKDNARTFFNGVVGFLVALEDMNKES